MATRRSARAAVAVALVVLLATASGGTATVAASAAPRDGAAAVVAYYQARIPELMDERRSRAWPSPWSTAPGRCGSGLRPY